MYLLFFLLTAVRYSSLAILPFSNERDARKNSQRENTKRVLDTLVPLLNAKAEWELTAWFDAGAFPKFYGSAIQ